MEEVRRETLEPPFSLAQLRESVELLRNSTLRGRLMFVCSCGEMIPVAEDDSVFERIETHAVKHLGRAGA